MGIDVEVKKKRDKIREKKNAKYFAKERARIYDQVTIDNEPEDSPFKTIILDKKILSHTNKYLTALFLFVRTKRKTGSIDPNMTLSVAIAQYEIVDGMVKYRNRMNVFHVKAIRRMLRILARWYPAQSSLDAQYAHEARLMENALSESPYLEDDDPSVRD